MSAAKDVDVLIRDARKAGLHVDFHNGKWRVTSDQSDAQAFIPTRATGRGLANARAAIRRLIDPPTPMVAAINPTRNEEEAMGWPIEQLLAIAEQQGVTVDVRGGLLHVSGPVEAEPFARLLRDRETDVLDHLNPSTKGESSVPQIGDVARIDHPAPVRDVARRAMHMWDIVRDLAREQGDERGLNAGTQGVLWRGAMGRVMREAWPTWGDDERREVASYLERTGHTKCQSRHANPPVWWIKSEWNDGDLKVTKTTPKPAPKPKANGAKPAAPVDMPAVGDPLAMLQAVAKRVSDAEQRADEAELMVAALEEENERLRGERDQYKAQVEEIGAAFRVLAGGSK